MNPPDKQSNLPARYAEPGQLTKELWSVIPDEQRSEIAGKHFEELSKLEVSAVEAEMKNRAGREVLTEFERTASSLERGTSSDHDLHFSADFKSGRIWGSAKKNNSTVIIVIAVAVVVLAFLILSR